MAESKNSRTDGIAQLIPRLVEAGLIGNRQQLELLSVSAIRRFKADWPEMTEQLGSLLAKFVVNGAAMRFQAVEPPPSDQEAGLALLKIEATNNAEVPVFEQRVRETVERFLRERLESELLLREGFGPPRTVLLKGAPGTGKTMLARAMAANLNLPFVILDLATSISSYLGKTGGNLRRSLDYARARPCLLLLDEFDAIGKRRDDVTEIGELRRIVNVLLKELEEWPMHSVLIAATNHPELLDPAMHRRFDVIIQIPLPGQVEREEIITRACGRFVSEVSSGFIEAISKILNNSSGSDLVSLSQSVVRRHVVEGAPLASSFIEEIEKGFLNGIPKKELGAVARNLQQSAGLSVREIAALIGKSSSTVQYHLTKREVSHA
jgi:SpoVK/Ycf46/Vps4 family AAA+-type ATPase